ncbi:MAG: PAS domain S-box protein, partial [Methanoregula sp.]|nr:PAS domain S-box protein [Methanoregula sp.]
MISVLYVDDEETLLDIGRLFLERSGDCSVDIAISARQALELMGKKTYDAIVSDYQMPEMDGIAFLKHIRATSDIPFILFTGKGREEVVIEAINNGADFYLQKGGDPKSQFVELEHKIRQAVKRQHAEHELRDSETRYRELVELLPQTVFEIDRRGMIISVNPVGLKAFGYTVEDLEKGVNAFQVFAPEDHQRLRENIQKILTGEPTGALEYTAQRKDGGTFPVLTYSVPIFRDQTPVGLRGVLVDITDRKQAEETLRDSEALLNTILQSSPIPKFVIDTNHRIISWNRALEEATGIRAEEVLGTTRQWMAFYRQERPCMADLIVDGSIDRIPELYKGKFQKSLLIEGAYEATDFFPHLGRKGMWLHFIAAPIMDSAGTVIGAVETLENITELKEAEEALRDSEKRYRNVVEDQTELICRFRPDGTLTFVNDAYCHYFGLKKDECIGKMHGVMLLPEDASKMKEHLKALTSENPVAGIEHRIIMPSGEERWQRWNDRAIFNESGALVEYQSVGRDTTDRKRAEEALQLVNERLRYLLASTSVAIYTSKTSGDYGATSITDNVLQITGYEPRDFIENSSFWIDHVHSEDKKKILDDLPKIFEKNFHFYEYRFRRKDGKYIWIFDEMRLNKDEGGKPREIIGQWMDITERKRAEEALRENEERYRNLFVSSRDAIMTLEPPSWRFTSGNPSTVQMFMARDEAEFTSKEPWMHSPERQPDGRDSSDKAREMIETAMRKGTHFFEWTHKRLSGEDFPATVLLSKVELAGKEFLQATVRDITDRKEIENGLEKANEKLTVLVHKFEKQSHLNSILTEMRDLLQACSTIDETIPIIMVSMTKLFPQAEGALFLMSPS